MEEKRLTVAEAIELIKRGTLPEPKIKHCIEIGRVAREIAKKCRMSDDEVELAEVLGIIHDIGRLGMKNGDQHPYEGYKYLKELGYGDKYAAVCLTHSFINGDPNCTAEGPILMPDGSVVENKLLPYEIEEDKNFVLNFLKEHKYTEIEKIINLCDLMVTDKIIGLDKRLEELINKKGKYSTTKNHKEKAEEIQTKIEEKMGCKIIDLFPEIIKNSQDKDTYRTGMGE